MIKTEWQPGILTPNRTTNRGEDYCWYNLASLLLSSLWKCAQKLQLWSDPFTISEIPPSQNASCSSPWVIFSIATSSSLDFFFFFFNSLWKRMPHTQAPSRRSPVCCVPQLRPRVGDLQSVFHPEALLVRSLESGKVTQQSDRFLSTFCQDDLIGRIDLWLCKDRETVRPSHRSGAQSVLNASTHAWVAVGCMLFLHHLCRSVKRRRAHKQINNETNHKAYLYFAAVLFNGIISPKLWYPSNC